MGNFYSVFLLKIKDGALGNKAAQAMCHNGYSVVFIKFIFYRSTEIFRYSVYILNTCPNILSKFRVYVLGIAKGFHVPAIHFRFALQHIRYISKCIPGFPGKAMDK